MRAMAEKALLAVLGVVLAVVARMPVDATLVVALLTAVSVTSAVAWMPSTRLAWLSTAMFVIVAAFMPVWRLFLPLAAYDEARMTLPEVRPARSGAWRDAVVFRAIPLLRWLWLLSMIPLVASLVTAGGPGKAGSESSGSVDSAGLTGMPAPAFVGLLVIVSCVGCALGFESRAVSSLHGETRRLRDDARERSRANRIRLADVAEERAQSVRLATLGERTRIAREIHDNVGHLLTRAIMQAQASRAVAEATGDDMAAQGFGALSSTLDDAMTMVRRSVHDLEDDGTDFAAQIDAAVRSFDGVSPGFRVSLTNDITDAPAPVARCFATVIREALSNVVHHSDAHEAQVTLRDLPALWQLVVQDPGPAASAPKPSEDSAPAVLLDGRGRGDGEQGRGMGVADIESRARALGGTALCGPYGDGWRVFVSLPKARWAAHAGDRIEKHGNRDDKDKQEGSAS
ncbi:two-component sensor histidine kinase [Bifidobacterium callitrichos]|uniref:histidine kinase n=1 Tax=Bifidobacterium callitrichos TaxID=762209 RepID=A0A2T3GAG8_9BIFI|nr:histidine kinase [Bifidobacterium callitrichos]PST46467.1 two-component sensor histidine kinase [Bifidobacterium callitrichos]